MQPTTPEAPQRPRRSDRYRQPMEDQSAYAVPVSVSEPQTAAPQDAAQPAECPMPVQRATQAPMYPLQQAPQQDGMQHPRAIPAQQPMQRPRPAPAPQAQAMQRPQQSYARSESRPPRMLQSDAPTENAVRHEARESYRLPVLLTTALTVLVLLCVGLFAAEKLMDAFLRTRQMERETAYQRVVNAHPMQYRDLIDRYAVENNLHPAFVCAIILNESSYNTSAESRVGARGLMQLMPDTAQWIAHKLQLDGVFDIDQLWQAETNIRFGCWYLGYLSDLFGGDAIAVASAYHAGQGEVSGWLANSTYAPNGRLSLDTMPEGPTKIYAGRVTRDYAIYDALYDQVFNKPAVGNDAGAAAISGG